MCLIDNRTNSKLLLAFAGLLLFTRCMFNHDPGVDCDYKKRPFTKKEELIVKTLENTGRNVKVHRINFEYRPSVLADFKCIDKGTVDYKLMINNEPVISFVDSSYLKKVSFDFFKELYSGVLEDSVIFGISDYIIEFKNSDVVSATNGTQGVFKLMISHSEMAKLNGFEVKKGKKGLYREPIPQSNEIQFEKYVFKPIEQ